MSRFKIILLSSILFAAPLAAQDARGTIVGRVTDQSGANIAGADVRATNVATGVVVAAKSNDAGNYSLPYLVPGMYTVSTETAGFRKFVRENVQVRVADTVELNVQLSVGDVTETIDVKAETPILSTAEASLGQVVDERRILELPLFSGNAMEFALLAPGTANGTDMRLRKAAFNNAPSQFSTDGSGIYGNEFTIDGVTNTYSDSANVRVAFSPPQASIGEFKVQTSAFDASLGHTTGSTVNISTKGGTNEIHGSAWWWLRHSALDTPDIFQNRSGAQLAVYQDNRYGIAAGGPVSVPKVYDGKNKTFWYFTYEANKFGSPSPQTASVPREAWRNGDLSDLLKLGANYQVYDPSTIQAAAGGRFSRQPFPGNIIPANRIDPAAKKILALYPLPNQAGTTDGRNNYFLSNKALEDYWATIGRFEHAFSEKDRMFIRVHRDFWQEDKNRTFRYGLSQQEFPEHRVSQGFDLASLGFAPSFVNLFPKGKTAVPNIGVGSLTTLSGSESGDGVAASLSHTFTGA